MKKRLIMTLLLAVVLTVSAFAAAPVNIERQSINGSEFVVKTYELPPNSDPATLIEGDFEQDGYIFAHHTTVSEEITATETKSVSEIASVESESKDLEFVLKKFPTQKPYEQDGYTGNLVLDTGSISTGVASYTTSSRSVSTTQTYPHLTYQDPAAVPQTAVKDGVTLPLTGVSWSVTGTSLAGDSLVPSEYTATATYNKKVSSKVPTGYVSTANYTGEVAKTVITGSKHTVTYIGTAIPSPTPKPTHSPTPMPIIEPELELFPWNVLFVFMAVVLAVGGGVLLFLWIKSRQGVAVFNLIDEDYLCIGRQQLDMKQPVIDLNEFADVAQSDFYSFVLDKYTTRKLFGRTVSVTSGDITMKHMVKDFKGPYRFNLEIAGGI